MKKKILYILGVLVLGIVTYSLATSQTIIPVTNIGGNTAYQSPLTQLPDPKYSCTLFTRNLHIGMSNPDVAFLQSKLIEMGYLRANATGYFGWMTFGAVKAFQRDNGIINTGYVGVLTRGVLQSKFCFINPVPPVEPGGDPYVAPLNCKVWNDGCNTCTRDYPGGPLRCTERMCIMDNMQTSIWRGYPSCAEYFNNNPYPTNPAPVISSISGPTQLRIGEAGTWYVSASVADNSYLTYEITWGDELVHSMSGLSVKSAGEVFLQGTTFQHTYNTAGVYTVIIKARSSNGQVTESTQTVNVIPNQISNEPPYNCKTWFDGCNTCGRSYPGGPMYCTLMACMTQKQAPYCSEYY